MALQNPLSEHPLFRQAQWMRASEAHRRKRFVLMALGVVLVCLGYRAVESRVSLITLLSAITPALLFSVIASGIVIYAVSIALTISGAINRAYEAHLYDLLSITPPGRFSATWAISAGSVHRKTTPQRFYFAVQMLGSLFIMVMLVALAVVLLVMLVGGFGAWAELFHQPALEFSNLLALALAFYVGSVQATVSGVLVGILIPTYAPDSELSHVPTIGIFLCLEGAIYLASGLLAVLIFPSMFQALSLSGLAAEIALPFLSLLAFSGIQEWVNRSLWNRLTRRLNGVSDFSSPNLKP